MSAGPNAAQPLAVEVIMAPRDKAQESKGNCCADIDVPPELPDILKAFTKSAITTQPRNLIHWSAAYFRSMCKGEVPPVKDRLEYPVKEAASGLTKGLLRVLHKQLGKQKRSNYEALKGKWDDICLNYNDAQKLLRDNGLQEEGFDWTQFVAAAAASLQNTGIRDIMEIVCFVMADNIGPGITPTIPIGYFQDAYRFLAEKFKVNKGNVDAACSFLATRAKKNGDLIGAKDFNDSECPPLEGTR